MSICDLYADWEALGPSSQRFEGLADFANDLLDVWGFDTVTILLQTPPPPHSDLCGAYDSGTETVFINPDHFAADPVDDAIACGIHEILHAAADQAQLNFSDVEEELLAALLSAEVLFEALIGCTSSDVPESGAEGNLPDYPWQSTIP